MREFRGGDGREAKTGESDFRVDWKGDRDMRTERKDGREHRGGGGGAGEPRGERGDGRRGGDGRESRGGSGTVGDLRGKSDDIRLSLQETGEVREGWGSRTFLKSHVEEEGEIGESTDDGGENTRFDGRKRDERDREERARDKIDRRGDLPVHISFAPSSQKRDERDREEKDRAEKEKDKERSKEKERAKEDKGEKERAAGKESEVDSWKESDMYRRQGGADQEEKDPNVAEKAEKQQRVSSTVEFDESAVETSAVRDAEDTNKAGNDAEAKDGKELEKGKMELGEEDKGKRKMRDHDRDREDAIPEVEDYEREVVSSYGVQRKRMLRPRGHHQSSTREVRPRFRVKDTDGWSARTAETSTLVYRIGEGLQEEIRRIRKEFESRMGVLSPEIQNAQSAPTIDVRIPAELATTSNRQVSGSQIWGTDVYTDDSDLVAVLMHTGYYIPNASSPPSSILEIRVTIRILTPQEGYASTLRNSVRSRAWGAASGCSFSVDHCHLVKKDGGKIPLEPRLTFTPVYAPTLAPAVTERTVTTRAVSMNAYRQQRFVQEVTIQYNLCNEPWLKYSMNIVADKGLKKFQYTSARIKKGDVLYVETHSSRYELSYEEPKPTGPIIPPVSEKGKEKADSAEKGSAQGVSTSHTEKSQLQTGSANVGDKISTHNGPVVGDKYRWALCKLPLPLSAMRSKGVPLPPECIKVLESGLGWEEVQWSPAGVCVRGKEYPLARAQFVSHNE